ncbi:MAG: YceI family protein [Dehalococcoidia bacterium]|nr:YceI family protein [Dehalococcoidia bacterium]
MTRARWLFVGAAAAVLVLGAGAWFTLLRDDAPQAVALASALDAAAQQPMRSPTAATATSVPAGPPASGAASSLAGTWTLASGASFVGYRVNEELANIGAKTAVGRTSAVTGTLTFDGAAITAVEVRADLRQLRSDEARRDRALEMQALETTRFPSATFVLTAPIRLERAPAEGGTVRATATGDFTLHGVTRRVEVPIEGQFQGGRAVVVGSLAIRFADFGIAPPRAPIVLSVEDHGVIELQLVFERR